MMRVEIWRPAGAVELEAAWRDLETRARPSFFQSWSWTGCLFAERFPRPLCLRAERDGQLVAIGLFNQARQNLYLGETGAAEQDSIYIEHNGLLSVVADVPTLSELLRQVGRSGWLPKRLILSGVGEEYRLAAASLGGRMVTRTTHIAPTLTLGANWLDGLSANSRQNLRRSMRAYGGVRVQRAGTIAQAHQFLDALAALHQESWRRRGRQGAFARPFFRRFHRELIARALPRDEIDLLCVSHDNDVIGYLYNFRYQGRVLAYQSGFNYAAATGAQKPGLTCHHAAIDMYRAMGVGVYDFLAGDHRYKRSLANGQTTLYWLTIYPGLTDFWRR